MFTEKDDKLKAHFEFEDFVEAWSFMSSVAIIAEKNNHHPTWSNTYNNVDISLTTHDAGNTVTEKDRTLAKEIENIYTSRHA